MNAALSALSRAGVSIWLDDLSRSRWSRVAWPTWPRTTTWWE